MQFRIISCEILERYLSRRDVLLIDLRSHEDYQKEHIKGAVWADWETLETSIKPFLKKHAFSPGWLILYCDHGNTSLLTARDLARNGYPVMSLNGGYSYWKKYEKRRYNS